MIRFFPIDSGVKWQSHLADLIAFDWHCGTADWEIPGEPPQILSVRFHGSIIVRLLDEFALSTETTPDEWHGLVKDHFAYRVEGDVFHESQSRAWEQVEGPTQHYLFITGNTCMDVIAANPPSFVIRKA